VLRFEQLLAVAFLTSALGLLFGLASRAYLSAVVRREDLVAANGALAGGSRAAGYAGPALGGALVPTLGAPIAVALDALSFASALLLRGIRAPEPAPPPPETRPGWGAAVGEGLRAVLGHPLLRPLALAAGLFELFDSAVFAVYVLYATRDVGLAPAVLGLVFAAGAVGGLAGVALSGRVARRLGPASALTGAFMVAALGELLIPVVGILAGTGALP
jgi:Na+/melibiose symporter-like transporter